MQLTENTESETLNKFEADFVLSIDKFKPSGELKEENNAQIDFNKSDTLLKFRSNDIGIKTVIFKFSKQEIESLKFKLAKGHNIIEFGITSKRIQDYLESWYMGSYDESVEIYFCKGSIYSHGNFNKKVGKLCTITKGKEVEAIYDRK